MFGKNRKAIMQQLNFKRESEPSILYKGRIPRFFLFLGSTVALGALIAGYFFNAGPLTTDIFNGTGHFFVTLLSYILLTLVSIRANFKCHQITCPAVFTVILLLGYYTYPTILLLWGAVLFFICMYIIVKTLFIYSKAAK